MTSTDRDLNYSGMGLTGMQERVELLSGTFENHSRIGAGTRSKFHCLFFTLMSNALDSQLAPTVSTIRVLIVDDHSVFRKGLRMLLLLRINRLMSLVKQVPAQEALDLLAENLPDVISLDIGLPDRSGLELLKIIKQRYPHMVC